MKTRNSALGREDFYQYFDGNGKLINVSLGLSKHITWVFFSVLALARGKPMNLKDHFP